MDNLRLKFPTFAIHEVFQVVAVAHLHEDVVTIFGLDSFPQVCHVLALDHVLV